MNKIIHESTLTTFIYKVFKELESFDNFLSFQYFFSLSSARNTNAKLIKLKDEISPRKLTGLFILTNGEDILSRNTNSGRRWFETNFNIVGDEGYLSTQWNDNGDFQLTTEALEYFLKLCYSESLSIKHLNDFSFEICLNMSDNNKYFPSLTPGQRINEFVIFGKKEISERSIRGYVSGLRDVYTREVLDYLKIKENIFEIKSLHVLYTVLEEFKKRRDESVGTPEYSLKKNYPSYIGKYISFASKYEGPQTDPTPEPDPTPDQIPFDITTLQEKVLSTGLLYSDQLIQRLVCSLLTKPFVILSGLAGSGKTQLALTLARVMSEDATQQICMVPVGADWTNREPLLGFPNALKEGEYMLPESGALQIMMRALHNPGKPYFLILDEMNLSYVERYFADFLSALESHEEIPLWDRQEGCESEVPKSIRVPENLFIIGTINVDETTYMFSPKVLDRANVLEFKVADDEMEKFLTRDRDVVVDTHAADGACANMGEDFMRIATNKKLESSELAQESLLNFFRVLKRVNAEFGYRSATEIYRFIAICNLVTELQDDEVLDAAIVQKLLPKLHGSRQKLAAILKELWKLCGSATELDEAEDTVDCKFKLSGDKILRMYKSALKDGFTSFAEA